MKNNKKIRVEYNSLCKNNKGEKYIAISEAEFMLVEDAIAFIDGLPKELRVTEVEDISNESSMTELDYGTHFDEEIVF